MLAEYLVIYVNLKMAKSAHFNSLKIKLYSLVFFSCKGRSATQRKLT